MSVKWLFASLCLGQMVMIGCGQERSKNKSVKTTSSQVMTSDSVDSGASEKKSYQDDLKSLAALSEAKRELSLLQEEMSEMQKLRAEFEEKYATQESLNSLETRLDEKNTNQDNEIEQLKKQMDDLSKSNTMIWEKIGSMETFVDVVKNFMEESQKKIDETAFDSEARKEFEDLKVKVSALEEMVQNRPEEKSQARKIADDIFSIANDGLGFLGNVLGSDFGKFISGLIGA